MAAPFYFDVNGDFQGNQLLNAVLENEADGTGLTVEGQIGYNTTDDRPQYRNASVVLQLASLSGTETFTNKTLTSPVINTSVSGTGIRYYSDAPGIRAIGSASDTLLCTEKAVRDAIDGIIASTNAMVYKGGIDCSASPNYPAADAGDTYNVTVAGKIGGSGGVTVEAGDTMTCTTDATVTGTQATVGAFWVIVQSNIDILPVSKGGLGANLTASAAIGDILYANSTTTFARLAKGTNGHYLHLHGTTGVVEWAAVPSVTAYGLTKTDDTNVTLSLGGTPASSLLAAVSMTLGWSGTLSVARGGSGQGTALTPGGVIWGASGTAMGCSAAGTAGQCGGPHHRHLAAVGARIARADPRPCRRPRPVGAVAAVPVLRLPARRARRC